jgi:putative oxidoreductase
MRALFILGRTLFGGYFLYNGINHLAQTGSMSQYAAAKGVPQPSAAVRATGAMMIAGGSSIVAGVSPRQGLATIIAFLVPTTLTMHRFWDVDDPNQRMAEMINFTKNIALVGAALTMMQIAEPWPASIDSARTEEEMFVRLGGRDLRALPA